MPINYQPQDTAAYLGLMEHRVEQPMFYRDTFFPETHQDDSEFIELSKLKIDNVVAPLIDPNLDGEPVSQRGEILERYSVASVNPRDMLRASDLGSKRVPGMGEFLSGRTLSTSERLDARRAELFFDHVASIDLFENWMSAQASTRGYNVFDNGGKFPYAKVGYNRDPAFTRTLDAGSYWGSSGVSIKDHLQKDIYDMGMGGVDMAFGGAANKLVVGQDVWNVMIKDEELKEMLNTDYEAIRELKMDRNLLSYKQVRVVGMLNDDIEIWLDLSYYKSGGAMTRYLQPNQYLMVGDDLQGIRCYSAIQDLYADLAPVPVFTREYPLQSGRAAVLDTKSRSLTIPRNSNNTIFGTVVAAKT